MNEITKDQAVGKTLKFIEIEEYGDQMIIGFSDRTYTTFRAVDNGSYDSIDIKIEPHTLNLLDFGDDALIALNLTTQEELDGLRSERGLQFQTEKEQRELQEFKRLSDKYRGAK